MKKDDQKIYRHEYVISDLQGCFVAFERLLAAIEFDVSLGKV